MVEGSFDKYGVGTGCAKDEIMRSGARFRVRASEIVRASGEAESKKHCDLGGAVDNK